MPVRVDGRDIYVNTGANSQTVKICSNRNIRGEYEHFFRIRPVVQQFGQEQMNAELSHHAEGGSTLGDVVGWLQHIGAVDELAPGAVVQQAAVGEEPPPQMPPISAGIPEPWFGQAKNAVDRVIDSLVDEFAAFPHMHRVEHSLHTRLVELCLDQIPIGGIHQIGATGEWTQLVHKEWPETTPRPGRRRGNFDVVVLSPTVVSVCPSTIDYLEGRLAAPIVIEVGLDYGFTHLSGDENKLTNSNVPRGYLLHFVRGRQPHPDELQVLNQAQAQAQAQLPVAIRTACVFAIDGQRWIKHVGDNQVQQII